MIFYTQATGALASTRLRQARSTQRRREIVEAALACFSRLGFDGTTIADIRRESKASTGSLYHHFASKEQLAAAVYLEGIVNYQAGLTAALERHQDAREGLFAVVRFHLTWVGEHPDWARFLFKMRHAEFMGEAEAAIQKKNQELFERMAKWFAPHVRAGRLRQLPKDVYASVLLGPCMDFARQWLASRASTDLAAAARAIGETTWQSLKGDPTA